MNPPAGLRASMFDIEITSTHLMVGIKGNSERFLNVASHSRANVNELHRCQGRLGSAAGIPHLCAFLKNCTLIPDP